MRSEKNVLKVRIYGAEYSILSDEDANYIKSVAEYLDKKLREVGNNVRVDSSIKVAILAALNIADEYFKEKAKKETLRNELEDKIKALNALIDKQL